MTPPTRRALSPRFLLSTACLSLLLSALPAVSDATVVTEALSNLKGLSPVDIPTVPTLRERVVEAGLDAIGTPYSWGGDDPDGGFDCSGLVAFVFKEIAGVDLPRRAADQRGRGKVVNTAQLQPGDLVFFGTSRRRNQTSHVGIYIGNNEFVHAPTRGSTVRVDDLGSTYWAKHFNGARRYLGPNNTQTVQVASRSAR
jgi:cell wall-associated NlpC family hydrolase